MTVTNGYCTRQEIASKLGIEDTEDDAIIDAVINAVSRNIDAYCSGRTFYARTETRLFDVPYGRELVLDDDLLTVTTLTNGDSTVLTTTDYYLWPRNVSPKHKIILKESSSYVWTFDSSGNTEGAISVVGTWGWASSAPADVAEACRIQTMRIFKRKDAPFGVMGSASMGQLRMIAELDPDVKMMLNAYRKKT